MDIYLKNRHWKFYFLLIAIIIVFGSILYTNNLVGKLANEEVKKIELWAEGMRSLQLNPDQDVSLINRILEQNETIPVILIDDDGNIVDHRNIKLPKRNEDEVLNQVLSKKLIDKGDLESLTADFKNMPVFDAISKNINGLTEEKKSLNDRLKTNTLNIGLNDKLAFIKHLFEGKAEDYDRVLSQVNTSSSFIEASRLIKSIVKPDYNNWIGKEVYEERFMEIIESKFN